MGGHHAISGAAAWLAVTAAAPALQVWGGLSIPVSTGIAVQAPAIALLGALVVAGWALVADLDHHSATAAQSVPVLGRVLAGAVSAAAGGHRKGTHTVWAVAAAAALAWFASKLVWHTHTPFGTVCFGLIALTLPAVAFAAHSIKILHAGTWPRAWLVGAAVAALLAASVRTDAGWLLPAVALGYTVHLAGDFLTVEGIAPLYPILPRPPEPWRRIPLLARLWHENGYMSLPVLGKTGSLREWALATALTLYVLYTAFYEVQGLVAPVVFPR